MYVANEGVGVRDYHAEEVTVLMRRFIYQLREVGLTQQSSKFLRVCVIQYRHLYAPANEHHVGAHGEETKPQRKIKYMNDKRKKSINYEKVRFQFCSEGVERESGITQVHRERVPHGRRGVVEPSWTQCLCFGSWDVQKSVQARG